MQDTMVVGIDDGKNILLCKILWGWGKCQMKINGKMGGGGEEISAFWEETKILCTKITGNKSNRVPI